MFLVIINNLLMPEKVLAMLKGGHRKFWGSFYAVA